MMVCLAGGLSRCSRRMHGGYIHAKVVAVVLLMWQEWVATYHTFNIYLCWYGYTFAVACV